MADTAARLLRLLSLLQAHQHWTGAALADRLKVSTRTVRADVERLRSLGYDIDATSGVAGGYQLRAGAVLPPLLLDDDEALAVAVGLHRSQLRRRRNRRARCPRGSQARPTAPSSAAPSPEHAQRDHRNRAKHS